MSEYSTRTTIHKRCSNFVVWIKPEESTREHVRVRANQIRKKISANAEEEGVIVKSTPEAGSFATHTGTRRHYRGNSSVEGQDVDIPFVLASETVEEQNIQNLIDFFYKIAKKAYPNSVVEKTKSSVKIKFNDNTNFDLVPMLATDKKEEQIILRSTGETIKTSVQSHVEFIRSRTRTSKAIQGRVKFNECLRLVKWWREFQSADSFYLSDDDSPPSFLINLLCAKAYDELSVEMTYSETLAKWFGYLGYIVRSREAIIFKDFNNPSVDNSLQWSVIDPVNPENNVVKNWNGVKINELADWFDKSSDYWSSAIRHDIDNNDSQSLDRV